MERREKGIKPEYPLGEEREKIRAERMKDHKKRTIHVFKEE